MNGMHGDGSAIHPFVAERADKSSDPDTNAEHGHQEKGKPSKPRRNIHETTS